MAKIKKSALNDLTNKHKAPRVPTPGKGFENPLNLWKRGATGWERNEPARDKSFGVVHVKSYTRRRPKH